MWRGRRALPPGATLHAVERPAVSVDDRPNRPFEIVDGRVAASPRERGQWALRYRPAAFHRCQACGLRQAIQDHRRLEGEPSNELLGKASVFRSTAR